MTVFGTVLQQKIIKTEADTGYKTEIKGLTVLHVLYDRVLLVS